MRGPVWGGGNPTVLCRHTESCMGVYMGFGCNAMHLFRTPRSTVVKLTVERGWTLTWSLSGCKESLGVVWSCLSWMMVGWYSIHRNSTTPGGKNVKHTLIYNYCIHVIFILKNIYCTTQTRAYNYTKTFEQ